MDDKIYKITLADGTVIDNLKLNGNNFISPVEIDETIFDGNCLNVTINDGEKRRCPYEYGTGTDHKDGRGVLVYTS